MKLALALLLPAAVAAAQPAHLDRAQLAELRGRASDGPPEVSVLTFGQGELIFEKFGHAAICLHYRNSGKEPVCFNYGVTKFSDEGGLVWGFLRSRQKFWMDPERWYATIAFYEYEDRDIWQQTLPLTPEQARGVETKIFTDLDAPSRYYVYDHFFDNCTTRVRDIIDANTGGKLRAGTEGTYPLTFREIGLRGLAGTPALVALTDFVIGRRLDDTPTLWEAMFYPSVLRDQIKTAFGVEPTLIYQRKGPPFATETPKTRYGMLVLALVFTLPLALAAGRKRFERAAVAWASLYLGLWGVILWTLAIISTIPGIRWNEAVLVLVPFDLVLPWLGEVRRRRYAKVRVVELLVVSILCAIGILHQPLWIPILTAIVPLGLIYASLSLTRPTN